MKPDTIRALETLQQNGCTCVLCRGELLLQSRERGVKPLLHWLDSGIDSQGACAADRVVGRAAAFLYVLLGIQEVSALTISQGALKVLQRYGIPCTYQQLVPGIRNRQGDGPCPMEEATRQIQEPGAALTAIRQKLQSLAEGTPAKEDD